MKIYSTAILVVTFCCSSIFAQTTKPSALSRASADGVPLPDCIDIDISTTSVPIIGKRLGSPPERVVAKVYNAEKSHSLLLQRTKISASVQWFGWGVGNANVCGLQLTDGRCSAIALLFNTMSDATFKRLKQDLEKFDDQQKKRKPNDAYVFTKLIRRGKAGAQFVAAIQPAEWYVITHKLKPKLQTAIRNGEPILGMTKAQLLLAMGEPSSQREAADGTNRYVWNGPVASDFRAVQTDLNNMAVGVSEDDTDPLEKLGKQERWGRYIVDVKDDIVTEVAQPRR